MKTTNAIGGFDTDPVFENNKLTASKFISGSEPFALGHYVGDPIFPGVFSFDLFLSLADELMNLQVDWKPKKKKVKRVQYIDIIRPGDVINVSVFIKKEKKDAVFVKGEIKSNGHLKSRANIEFFK